MIRVAYSGEPGAFAEDAVVAYFAAPETVPLPEPAVDTDSVELPIVTCWDEV